MNANKNIIKKENKNIPTKRKWMGGDPTNINVMEIDVVKMWCRVMLSFSL